MRMKKLVVFFFGVFLLILMGLPAESAAGVNINVGISVPLPPFRIHTPPPMFVIPGTYVYAIPDIDVEIFFYQGYWYRPYEGRWYRSKSYNGPWAYRRTSRVPRALLDVPPDYYSIPQEYERIPYGHFRNNWGRWERERYWERNERWQEGRRRGPGRDFGPAGPPPPPRHVAPPPPPPRHVGPPPPAPPKHIGPPAPPHGPVGPPPPPAGSPDRDVRDKRGSDPNRR